LNDKRKNLQVAFLQGALLGPLAVFPASLLLFVAVSIPTLSISAIYDGLFSSIFVSIWGVCIAYLVTFTFGSLLWIILLKIRILSLKGLMAGTLLPSIGVGFYTQSFGFTFTFAYYSLVVCFSCWYLGLRNIQNQS
jgi:uncharacterized BrkB/YihY/UPF0761 family membrane protein